jgi:hypothetical protein
MRQRSLALLCAPDGTGKAIAEWITHRTEPRYGIKHQRQVLWGDEKAAQPDRDRLLRQGQGLPAGLPCCPVRSRIQSDLPILQHRLPLSMTSRCPLPTVNRPTTIETCGQLIGLKPGMQGLSDRFAH